jgi:hypothetical protein
MLLIANCFVVEAVLFQESQIHPRHVTFEGSYLRSLRVHRESKERYTGMHLQRVIS